MGTLSECANDCNSEQTIHMVQPFDCFLFVIQIHTGLFCRLDGIGKDFKD